MSAWTYRCSNGKAAPKIVPPRLRIPGWKGLGADSEEKREPVSDIDTAVVDSLTCLTPDGRLEKRTLCRAFIAILDVGFPSAPWWAPTPDGGLRAMVVTHKHVLLLALLLA